MQTRNKIIETMKLLDDESILNRIYDVRVFLLVLLVGMAIGCNSNQPTEFALYDECANFPPPPGESWTYRIVGTSITFTNITEEVNAMVGGYDVYRIREVNNPPGLGEYIGCDPDHGEVEVATDSWDINDPSNNEMLLWEPPIFTCAYGTSVGSVPCEWIGTFDGEFSRVVTEVIAYETVSVPFGTFENTMKITRTKYDATGVLDGPLFFWVDANVGIVKAQEVESGITIELIGYNPSSAKSATASKVANDYRTRSSGIGFWRSKFTTVNAENNSAKQSGSRKR